MKFHLIHYTVSHKIIFIIREIKSIQENLVNIIDLIGKCIILHIKKYYSK